MLFGQKETGELEVRVTEKSFLLPASRSNQRSLQSCFFEGCFERYINEAKKKTTTTTTRNVSNLFIGFLGVINKRVTKVLSKFPRNDDIVRNSPHFAEFAVSEAMI